MDFYKRLTEIKFTEDLLQVRSWAGTELEGEPYVLSNSDKLSQRGEKPSKVYSVELKLMGKRLMNITVQYNEDCSRGMY